MQHNTLMSAPAPQRARLSESPATATAALFVCAPADTTLTWSFATLPLPDLLRVFALLPADERARAATVCQTWRYVLTAGPTSWRLWTEVDLSETSGVTCTRGDAALEAVTALARGRLRTLKLRDFDVRFEPHSFTVEALLCVVNLNARLEELTYVPADNEWLMVAELQLLLAAVPTLQRLITEVETTDAATARALLRREPPYAAVNLCTIGLTDESDEEPLRTADSVIAFAADVAACESLRGLALVHANLRPPAALQALIDAALTRRLESIHFNRCEYAPAAALPQLAYLLERGRETLTRLAIEDSPSLFEDVQEEDFFEGVQLLCDVLSKGSSRLKSLDLSNVGLREGQHTLMEILLHRMLCSRPAGSPEAEVTVE